MAINFPVTLDSLTNPLGTDKQNSPSHSGQHSNLNDIVEALESKVGINSSADVNSLDYKVANKVDKVAGSRLITTAEGVILGNTSNTNTGDNATNTQYSGLASSKEDVTNKQTDLTASATKYPTVNAVNTGLATKQNSLGYTAENNANKKTSLADNSDTFYPTQKAVKTAVDAKQNTLGFTPENSANKVTSISGASTDVQYPSAKLVYDQLAGKQATGSYEVTTNKENTTLDTSTIKYPTNRLVKEYADGKVEDNITDGHTTVAPSGNAVFDALALKAPLASPTFTGTPSLPTGTTGVTQSANDNSTKIATTAYIDQSLGTNGRRALTISTADPSGGVDGDVWFKYV